MRLINDKWLILVTDMGDSGLLAAGVVVASVTLWLAGNRRAALALFCAFAGAVASITIAKLLFIGCYGVWGMGELRSPSGHAALSFAVFGMSGVLLGQGAKGWKRLLPVIILTMLALAIAATRVMLHMHSVSEVIVGVLVGATVVCVAWFVFLRGHAPARFNKLALVVPIVLAVLLLHGERLHAEGSISKWAEYLKVYLRLC